MTTPSVQYYTITQGNTLEPIQGVVYKGDGTPQDLTGATVTFTMKLPGDAVAKVDKQDAVVVVAAAGSVKYEWKDEDVDTPGIYDAEFTVTKGGKTLTFPNRNKIVINIVPPLS